MDNPLYPAPSTGAAIGMLIINLLWLLLLGGGGFVTYRFLRNRGYITRMRQNLDGQAARTGYSHGMKDGEQRAQQRHELTASLEQVNDLLDKVNRVGERCDDVLRTMNRPSTPAAVAKETDRPKNDPGSTPPAATAPEHRDNSAPAGKAPADKGARRLGQRTPRPAQVDLPAGSRPRSRPTPPIPAGIDAATAATPPTPPTPAPTSAP